MNPRSVALCLILLLAAALRFAGLGWGLRHAPEHEERLFVAPVGKMLLRHDLDHRFYEYPGLFLYLLLPAVRASAASYPPGPGAYLAARSVVAAFGVASVGLVFLLTRRLAGPAAGLGAALLLAVAPMEVETAHQVRPDVVLEAFVLLFLLSLVAVGTSSRGDALSGGALGAAAGVKFTGALLVPSYVLARLLAPGPRLRGALQAGAVAALVWCATTPYALLKPAKFKEGALAQLSYHYRPAQEPLTPPMVLGYYGVKIREGFGTGGCLLALAGLVLAARDPRRWAPYVAWPLVLLAVLSTAQARYGRLALSSLCVLSALAGLSLGTIAQRWPRAALGIALLAASPSLASSVQFVRATCLPSTLDEVADWTSARLPAGARILTGVAELGLDRRRFEVLPATGARDLDGLLARHSDYVVWPGASAEPLEGLAAIHVAEPALDDSGPRLVVARVPEGEKPSYRSVPLAGARASASTDAGSLAAVVAGTKGASWQTPGGQGPEDWIEVLLPEPAKLGRVTMFLAHGRARPGRFLRLLETRDGREWAPIRAVEARAPAPEQSRLGRGAPSQVFVFAPRQVRGIRIGPGTRSATGWGFVALRLESPVTP